MLVTRQKIYREYGGPVCRACMNEITGVHLVRKNCWYMPYKGLCPRCHVDDKNLVAQLKFSGTIRALFHL